MLGQESEWKLNLECSAAWNLMQCIGHGHVRVTNVNLHSICKCFFWPPLIAPPPRQSPHAVLPQLFPITGIEIGIGNCHCGLDGFRAQEHTLNCFSERLAHCEKSAIYMEIEIEIAESVVSFFIRQHCYVPFK